VQPLDYLLMLPPDALRRAANDARKMATRLDRAADLKDHRHNNRIAVRRHRAKRAGETEVLAAHMAAGMSPGQALRAAAQESGLEPQRLQPLLTKALGLVNRRNLEIRNRKMMKLARRGLTDNEIGNKCINPKTGNPLHPKSVNRILSQLWREAV